MKSFIALALIPESDMKFELEDLYATTTEIDQLHLYLNYFDKTWAEKYVRGILRKDLDFEPGIWNQFINASNGYQKTTVWSKNGTEFFD